jgi:hydrogenase expression/formation protein HypC
MCVALPLRVQKVDGEWALVEVSGGTIRVRSDLVSVEPGDYVLVHAGFIIEKLDAQEAKKTLEIFQEIKA